MKRYIVFAGSDYYPAGGWDDHFGSFDSVYEGLEALKPYSYDWWHIVDSDTGKEVRIDELNDLTPPTADRSKAE